MSSSFLFFLNKKKNPVYSPAFSSEVSHKYIAALRGVQRGEGKDGCKTVAFIPNTMLIEGFGMHYPFVTRLGGITQSHCNHVKNNNFDFTGNYIERSYN